jgi:putative heme-binding domain-containing protein
MKLVALAALAAAMCLAQTSSQEDVAAGGRLYRSICAECHGAKGEGGRGPRLDTGAFIHGSSDEALFNNIQRGIPGTEMPGIYNEGKQIWQIVAFVRNLSRVGGSSQAAGDPTRGAGVYRRSGCAACHFIDGEGGRLGPDLSVIGSARSREHLRQSLAEPSAVVAKAWWPVEVAMKDGATVRGYVLNEDTYHVRLIDESEKLRSIPRDAVREVTVRRRESRMPSYDKLSEADMNDLLAYLSSLRRSMR